MLGRENASRAGTGTALLARVGAAAVEATASYLRDTYECSSLYIQVPPWTTAAGTVDSSAGRAVGWWLGVWDCPGASADGHTSPRL
ncbi:hypothetical protein XA68_12031 [Ophiocordyceps unilateralis]|uniref:Uncharacterized protein n=1 Tax=Ophiocordyceps unilateralis TaxID=268505 RepID=A0A2A9PE54_OPHUN|nr:hypothetical protein XA68_12031 [Ophiocordyceps unilateralis]